MSTLGRIAVLSVVLLSASCVMRTVSDPTARGYWCPGPVTSVLLGRAAFSDDGDVVRFNGRRLDVPPGTIETLVALVEDSRAHGDGLQLMCEAFAHILLLGPRGEVRTWLRFNRDGETVSIIADQPFFKSAACMNPALFRFGMDLVRAHCEAEFRAELRRWDEIATTGQGGRMSVVSGLEWRRMDPSTYEGRWLRCAPSGTPTNAVPR
jgi:hypothetical protein